MADRLKLKEDWSFWGSPAEHECLEMLMEAADGKTLGRSVKWLTLKDIEAGMAARRIYYSQGHWTKLTDRLAIAGYITKKTWGREKKHEITAKGYDAAKIWKLITVRMEQVK